MAMAGASQQEHLGVLVGLHQLCSLLPISLAQYLDFRHCVGKLGLQCQNGKLKLAKRSSNWQHLTARDGGQSSGAATPKSRTPPRLQAEQGSH